MRARGVSPSSSALASVIISTAAAPSEICDELPAVCTPSSRATGFSVASFSSVRLAQALVALDRVGRAGRLARPRRRRRRRPATHWPSKRPSAHARAARCCESKPKRVGVLAGDAPLVGDALGALELRRHLVAAEVRLRDRHAEAELLRRVDADRDAAHHLDAAGEGDVDDAGADERRRPGWWPAGSSRTACRSWWPAVVSGQPGGQPRGAGDVEALLADLADAAADDLADRRRVDARCARRWRCWTTPSSSAGWTLESPPPRRPIGRADGIDDDDGIHSPWREPTQDRIPSRHPVRPVP